MNARPALDGFDFIGDDPGSIKQLRKLIVALAVAGKLTSTAETTIDANTLLGQIEKEKLALIRIRQLREQKPTAKVGADDLVGLFQEPTKFVRLGSIARIEKGLTGIMKAGPGPYPLVVTAESRATCDHFDFDGAAAIVPLVSSAGHGKASLQRLHYQEGKFALGSILAAVFPHAPHLVTARFLFEYLTAFKEELLVSQMIGTANVSLSVGKVANVPVPLVAPSVQRKVGALMALCDQLETARAQRETKRDRLTAASLARLNAPDAETFQDDTRFALAALPALTARVDQIKQLRQTILNLAVRGKLVAQDPNDEPAAAFVKRVKAAKAQAFAIEGLRQRTALPAPSHDDVDFDLPRNWALITFDEAFVIVSGVTKGQKVAASESVEAPYLRVANVQRGYLNLSIVKSIAVLATDIQRYELRDGDVLMTEGGDWDKLGRAAIWRNEIPGCIHQNHVFRVRPGSSDITPEWVASYTNSPAGRAYFENAAKQTTNLASINLTQLRSCPLPLPPLAEQHRIVAKVDALMALCDQLEASLSTSDDYRRRLLESLLHEALQPAKVLEQAA